MKSTKVERRGGDAEPTYLKWAQGLEELLKDDTGCELFQNYLEREDKDRYNMLNFLFAYRGLSKMQPTEADHIIKIIYKMWFRKAHLKIGEEIRKDVTRRFLECSRNNDLLSASIFNEAFNQVEKIMNTVAYPNFLQSDVFLAHVNDSQNLEEPILLQTPCDHSYEKEDSLGPINYLYPQQYPLPRHQLPILEENEELTMPLTTESLLRSETLRVTQRCRLPISDSYPCQRGPPHPYHVNNRLGHLSCNPVSTQDSELQSLSSDARTDSMSDINSLDGFKDEKKRVHQQFRRIRQMASMNRVPDTPILVPPPDYKWRSVSKPTMKPEEFASILSSKLEVVKLEEENKQRIEQKLSEANINPPQPPAPPEGNAKILRDVIMRRCIDDESDEDILNQHVSKVFKTPSHSPSLMTPILPKSPPPGDSKWMLPPPKIPPHGRAFNQLQYRKYQEGQYDGYRQRIPNARASVGSLGTSTDSGVYTGTSHSSQSRFFAAGNADFPSGQAYNPGYEANVSLVSGKYKTKSLMSCETLSRNKTGQPFAQDPLMPLLPPPHTPSQLDEVARVVELLKLDDNAARKVHNKSRSRNSSLGRSSVLGSASSQQSYRGVSGCSSKMQGAKFGEEVSTTAICRFSDEDVPYSLKVPGNCVTLRQFKDILPKRGNYRYFFMTVCEDIDGPIQEEITHDSQILPLWKDKINAQIKVIACDSDKE